MKRWIARLLLAKTMLLLPSPALGGGGSDYLMEADLARVRQYWPAYRAAAECTGVPVMALPAIHYRESDLCGCRGDRCARQPVRCIGGPFMLDCGCDGDPSGFDRSIRCFERSVAMKYDLAPAPKVRDDFNFACLVAAEELRSKVRGAWINRKGRIDLDVLADAFWGYNGRLPEHRVWWHSPYVNNHPKAGRRFPIKVRMGATSTTYLDSRPGTLIIYRELVRRLASG